METLEFFEWLLPPNGNVVLGIPKKENGREWWQNRKYTTIAEAAAEAVKLDQTEEVYVAISTFNDFYRNDKGKHKIRTKENVAWCRALYDDYDVDPAKENRYETKLQALRDIGRLAQALRLTPTVVDSGGGYHSYFHFEDAVDVATWDELASLKRDITTFLGIKTDPTIDMNSACVLRPIGTHNKKEKYDSPRPVQLLKQGKRYSVETIRSRMQDFIQQNNITPAPKRKPKGKKQFGVLVESYPASDAETIAEHCAAVRALRDTQGNIDEPHWHRAIGVVKFCKDGEDKIHEWSSGYEGYTYEETQAKIEQWEVGPTSCVEMDKVVGCKTDCPVATKCKFPIQLGASEQADSVAYETVVEDDDNAAVPTPTTIEGQSIPHWPASGFRWDGTHLQRSITDADGIVTWRNFSRLFVYPINRIRNSEGTWVVHWRAKEKNGRWREFFMPTAELASPSQMAETFASNEVFLVNSRSARSDMAEFAQTLIETLQKYKVETKTYEQFGWTEDRKGFVMGTKMITENGTMDVLCDSQIPPDVAVDFGRSGTLEEWVANINTLYNRQGAEPFQFALCHSMGSVLVELMASSNWHGLPLAFTGHGGTGKTTACKIACGFYGNPKLMNRQANDQGTTLNAVIKRIAATGPIPLLLDEFSGRSSEELTRTGYALANGRDKERLSSSGSFATMGHEWFKNSLITSNDSILESIAKLPAGYRVEATQLRFFEVSLGEGLVDKVFPDTTQSFVEHHMDHVYGEACLPFIRFVMKNLDWVRRQLAAARAKFNPKSEDDNKERFYRDTIVTALVAGLIAKKIGLVSFDINAMKQWAVAQVKLMRESRKEVNTDIKEHLAAFISTLHGRLIITKRLGSANTHKEESQTPIRTSPAGRLCTEDKKAFITVKAVTDWCKDNSVAPSAMRDELDRSGYLIFQPNGEPNRRMYIGQGSTVPTGLTRCYELKYHKLMDGVSLAEVPAPEVQDAAAS
jgi:hypothetical protein